jgi:glucosamine--fructose-6-phosphate aminotransferase (isomerizing)
VTGGGRTAADIAEQPEILSRVVSVNDGALMAARKALSGARVVRFVGLGSGRHAAGYGACALDVLTDVPASTLPAPGIRVSMPRPRHDEPLIVVSQSGRTPALIALANRSRAAGSAVIAVVNDSDSPLEEIATITLRCAAGPERVIAATKSVTAQCLLLRALAKQPTDAEIAALVSATERAIALGVDGVASIIRPAVVVAGSAAEWIADEVALKITEMCGVPVTSDSVVDHFHGPIASGVDVLAFLDPTDPNSTELASRDGVTTVGPDGRFDLETPSTGDPMFDAIVTLVVGQRIAAASALAAGSDPDADRGLGKVTPTR